MATLEQFGKALQIAYPEGHAEFVKSVSNLPTRNPGVLGYYPRERDWVRVPDDMNFEIPHSELAMHCQFAGKQCVAVIVSPSVNYAYVLTEDGEWTHGLLNEVMPPSHNKWAATVAWEEPIHVVLTKHEGYTEFRTSHSPNRTGSEPMDVTEIEQFVRAIRAMYPGCTVEII